jgi:hypothetical protein
VKQHHILKEKNTLEESGYSVTEFRICNISASTSASPLVSREALKSVTDISAAASGSSIVAPFFTYRLLQRGVWDVVLF